MLDSSTALVLLPMSNNSSIVTAMSLSTRSDIVPIDPSEAAPLISGINLSQYFQIATVTALVYDAIITTDKEAKYFWKLPRKTVNFVYFVNRYTAIFGAAFTLRLYTYDVNPLFEIAFWTENITSWVTIILMDCKYRINDHLMLALTITKDILMIRVLALYSQDRMLSIFLKTILSLEACFKLGLDIFLILSEHLGIGEIPTYATVCIEDSIPPWQWIMVNWIIPTAYGTILMGLALYKAAEYWRMSANFKGFKLVKVLIQDQVLYFMFVVGCSVLNIISVKVDFANDFASDVLSALGNPSWLSLLGSRMLFRLKEAGERGENEGTSYSMPSGTVSEIDFADPGNHQRQNETEGVESAEGDMAEA